MKKRPESRRVTSKYACFDCRKAFLIGRQRRTDATTDESAVCPQCGAPMVRMGKWFKPPRRADKKQWAKVRALARHGFFYSAYGSGPGYRPGTMREVSQFLAQARGRRRLSPGERLLAKMEADARPRPSRRKR